MTDLRLSEQQDAVALATQAISQDLAQAHEAMGMVKAFSFVQKLATVANWEEPPPRSCVLKRSRIKTREPLQRSCFSQHVLKQLYFLLFKCYFFVKNILLEYNAQHYSLRKRIRRIMRLIVNIRNKNGFQ